MLLHFQEGSMVFIAPKNGVCCYSSDGFIILEDYQALQDYGYTT